MYFRKNCEGTGSPQSPTPPPLSFTSPVHQSSWVLLKGQCHEIFWSRFFSWITSLPQAPGNNIRVISSFFESSRRYSQVKVHHRYRRDMCQICQRRGVNYAAVYLPLVSSTPVANLPPVSTTPAANFAIGTTGVVDTGGKFATGVNDTCGKFVTRCQRHWWQIMGTISGCRYLQVNLKAKIYI